MYFLIGLGIIVIIVYGNMFYDRIKTKKNKDTTDVEQSAGTADNHFAEQKETKGQKTEINRQAPDQDQSGSMVKTAANIAFSGPTLTQMIADDLKQKKHIFGLPLTLCEERGDGQLIALDREDNIYVIETVQRADYEEFYLQILDDMAVQRKRIQKNMKDHQIPQGSSISAVLANIYMIEADKKINEYVVSLGGMYRRYSDDFIVVVPKIGQELSVFNRIIDIIHSVPNLQLEPSKTQIFEFSNNQIENVGKKLLENADTSKKVINFLGFTFDGGHVSVRSKTISKYYYRMYRKAKSIAKNPKLKGSDNLYRRYSVHGADANPGNFFTYIKYAEEAFGKDELIYKDLQRHIPKIRKALKKK